MIEVEKAANRSMYANETGLLVFAVLLTFWEIVHKIFTEKIQIVLAFLRRISYYIENVSTQSI